MYYLSTNLCSVGFAVCVFCFCLGFFLVSFGVFLAGWFLYSFFFLFCGSLYRCVVCEGSFSFIACY